MPKGKCLYNYNVLSGVCHISWIYNQILLLNVSIKLMSLSLAWLLELHDVKSDIIRSVANYNH